MLSNKKRLLPMLLTVIIMIFGLYSTLHSFTGDEIEQILDRKKEYNIKREDLRNIYEGQFDEKMQAILDFVNSEEMRQKVKEFQQEIVNYQGIKEYYKDAWEQIENNLKEKDLSSAQILIFVSSSIPKGTVKNYINDVIRYGLQEYTQFVLRGVIGNDISKFMPTINYIRDLTKKDPNCQKNCEVEPINVIIDPLLYRKLGIDKVPALAVVSNIEITDPLQSLGKEDNAKFEYDVVYGDANLRYLLEVLANEKNNGYAKSFLNKIERR